MELNCLQPYSCVVLAQERGQEHLGVWEGNKLYLTGLGETMYLGSRYIRQLSQPVKRRRPYFLFPSHFPTVRSWILSDSTDLTHLTNLAETRPFSPVFYWKGELICLTLWPSKHQRHQKVNSRNGSEVSPFSIRELLNQSILMSLTILTRSLCPVFLNPLLP